ncbi:CPBP family intramembrane glutamic endopeptidase [Priestia koreensis]|uniref:CPBP family intramembrane glutamic endopeptidase n=1 Tax=Priestia koreensis TaxID=284581 RepID=UPI00345A6D20
MKKQYWYIIVAYVIMQLTLGLGAKLLAATGLFEGYGRLEIAYAGTTWTIIAFAIVLILTLFWLRSDMRSRGKANISSLVFWSIIGIFMALAAQAVAALIETNLFKIEAGSENTESLIKLIKLMPAFIFVTSVIGPILEEIIFRKIIFGSLHKHFNFLISAIISALIFAVVHMDFSHILVYTAMGLVFAYLYSKTKHIIVSIFAHVMMNTIVVVTQTLFADDLERIRQQSEQLQFIFGGFLS